MASTGLHTNGYSLARKLLFDVAGLRPDSQVPELASILADALLQVHRSYLKPLQSLVKADTISAAAHITGGGITDNLPRVLPKGLAAVIDTGSWQVPPLFELLRHIGNVPEGDWRRTFNLGVGMIFVVPAKKADKARRTLKGEAWVIGEIAARRRGKGRVEYR
jgi:phosphoribosylformylglycinamidine cyclo-ligase